MSISLSEYQAKLTNNILSARSQDEVKRLIETSIKSLEKHKVNGHIVNRFVERMNSELLLLSPMNKNAQQWSNISMARILFNRIQLELGKVHQ